MKIATTLPNRKAKSPFHKKADPDAPKPERIKKEKPIKDDRLFDVSKFSNWMA